MAGKCPKPSALSLQAEKKPTSAKQCNNMSCVLPVRAACFQASILASRSGPPQSFYLDCKAAEACTERLDLG